jgi:hypothetical protein
LSATTKSVKPQLAFVFLFQPLNYLTQTERSDLSRHLLAAVSPSYFELHALRRKHLWAFEVPRGGFAGDLGLIDAEKEFDARAALFEKMKPRLFRTRDRIDRDGITYFQRAVLVRVQDMLPYGAQRALFTALVNCMDAAVRGPTIVMGQPERRPGLSPDQRRAIFGHNIARGVAWSPEEDLVLRKWFSVRTIGDDAGKHVPLSPEMWAAVLEELKGVRSKHSVQQRINALNAKLLTELLQRQQAHFGTRRSDGLRRSFLPEYMRRVLGERPRVPRTRDHRGRRHDAPASLNVAPTSGPSGVAS